MKIQSRPTISTDEIGTGDITLRVNTEQLELIAALLCHCRLGTTGYPRAAAALIGAIENAYGDDWLMNASDNVDMQVNVEDRSGNTEFVSIPGMHFVMIEVQ